MCTLHGGICVGRAARLGCVLRVDWGVYCERKGLPCATSAKVLAWIEKALQHNLQNENIRSGGGRGEVGAVAARSAPESLTLCSRRSST